MAEDRRPGKDDPLTEAERLRLQALADKRNQAMDTMANTIRKHEESRRDIIDKMR